MGLVTVSMGGGGVLNGLTRQNSVYVGFRVQGLGFSL